MYGGGKGCSNYGERDLMEHKKEIYRKILRGERAFYGAVIVVDTIAYTVSFLVSGLVKKDIFNLLEGREGTLGITSLRLLILLNVAMPLLINCVKQVNSAMTARVRMRFDRKIKSGLLWEILSERMGEEQLRGFGESVSLIPAFGITALVRSLDRWIVKFRRDARSSTGIVREFLENVLRNTEYFRLSVGERQLAEIFAEKCRIRSGMERRDRVLDKALGAASGNASGLVLGNPGGNAWDQPAVCPDQPDSCFWDYGPGPLPGQMDRKISQGCPQLHGDCEGVFGKCPAEYGIFQALRGGAAAGGDFCGKVPDTLRNGEKGPGAG